MTVWSLCSWKLCLNVFFFFRFVECIQVLYTAFKTDTTKNRRKKNNSQSETDRLGHTPTERHKDKTDR